MPSHRSAAPRAAVVEFLESRRLLASVPSGFAETRYGPNLSNGTTMEFSPEGRLFVLQQGGAVRVIDTNGTLLATPFVSLSVDSFFERGLLGIAFDPDYASSRHVYLYYTVPSSAGGPYNRVSRFTANAAGTQALAGSELEILRLDPLSAGNHNGGAMHFGVDGKLYIAVGDNAVGSNAQSVNNRHGKLLRINRDGTIPADNPATLPNSAGAPLTPTGVNRAIWAMGLRNPYTFAVQRGGGRIHINDVGQSAWEEINVGAPGANFGWPGTEGSFNQASFPGYTRPLHAYANDASTCAITGGDFYNPATPMFPASYVGDYFFADFCAGWIRTLDFAGATPVVSGFLTGGSSIVDLEVGPDGALYYLQRGGGNGGQGVVRVAVSSANAPSILQQPQSQTVTDGQPATFSVDASGAGPFQYQWRRDGVDIDGAVFDTYTLDPATLADSGAQFSVVVSNAFGQRLSAAATLTVNENVAPTPAIDLPGAGATFIAGQSVTFSGSATDLEDGALPATSLTWRVDYHTGQAGPRPFLPPTSGVFGGSFTPEQITPYLLPDVFYRVHLEAVDSLGRIAATFVDVLPVTATITLAAAGIPDGAMLLLDGQPVAAPHVFTSVAGLLRPLEAPPTQVIDGQTHQFVGWSSGAPASHTLLVPASDATLTATYLDVTAPQADPPVFIVDQPDPAAPAHRLLVTFSEDIGASLDRADIEVLRFGGAEGGVPIEEVAFVFDAATRAATLTFPSFAGGRLGDGDYRLTIFGAGVADAAGNALPGDVTLDFHVLAADANRDRVVDVADLGILSTNWQQAGRVFSQGDLNYDGVVDVTDLGLLASLWQSGVPAAPKGLAMPVAAKQAFSRAPIRIAGERGGFVRAGDLLRQGERVLA